MVNNWVNVNTFKTLLDVNWAGAADGTVPVFNSSTGYFTPGTISSVNIYNEDGSLDSTRTLSTAGFDLIFDGQNVDNLFYLDSSADEIGIGATGLNARFGVLAQGTTSTDKVFSIRNAANNDSIFSVKGNRNIYLLGETSNGRIELSVSGGNTSMIHRADAILPSVFYIGSNGQGGSVGQVSIAALDGNTAAPTFTFQRLISGVSDLTGSAIYSAFGTNAACFIMRNADGYASGTGTNPSGTAADHFAMYSADISAGNASPHFRTEAGQIIKLFRGAAIADASGGSVIDVEARAALNALLARFRVTGGSGQIAD